METQLLKGILEELKALRKEGKLQEVFDLREAAGFLRISENTLRGWTRERKIPFSKVNGSLRFKRSKLERWLDLNEIPMQ
ncbi:helix-turn-helix domain-containing protein [bacterium]|nr:helix-turn-helix domain-containing protein [bacterium]